MKKLQLLILSVFISTIFGCSTYTKQSQEMANAWQAGDGMLAASLLSNKVAKVEGDDDELIWELEYATVLSSIGDMNGSIEIFDKAEKIINKYEEKAKVALGQETGALLTNQAALPYRGHAYDKIMVNTYKSLNYMILQEHEKARVELNRSLQRQKDAVSENGKRINRAQQAAEESKEGSIKGEDGEDTPEYDTDRAQQDPKFAAAVNEQMGNVDKHLLAYADYVNPFAVFLDGIYFGHQGQGNSDLERARKSLERVKNMSPGKYITADYAMVEAMQEGNPADNVTYILFFTGSAPSRDQTRIDIPLFLVTDQVSYIGASFPKLKYHDDFIDKIVVSSTNGTYYSSELLCSMDAVISKDFKNDWPVVVTKTLLTTATKAIIARSAEEVAKQTGGTWAKYATKIGGIAYQAGTNIADTRTWRTLPKQISYIRMPTPNNGIVKMAIGSQIKIAKVLPKKTNVIIIRSVNTTASPIIQQLTLN